MSHPRVLITGATGLIGSHLTERLRKENVELHAVSRHPPPGRADISWWAADLAESGSITRIIRATAPDFIFHLAGHVVGDRSIGVVRPTLLTNLLATVELLEAATVSGCTRTLITGSFLEEPAALGNVVPPSPYGASRWAASGYGRMFHALYSTPVVILRPSYVYGPGQRDQTKLIPYVITALLDGRWPRLTSGKRLLDWLYADDAAGVEGETIDIGSGLVASVTDMVDRVLTLVAPKSARPIYSALPNRPLEQPQVQVDTDRAAALLSWRAHTGINEGLRSTVDWFAQLRREHRPYEGGGL
jgi:nucleoside-diphosphate-sugar epimerase